MTSMAARASRSAASRRGTLPLPTSGPGWPTWEVVKKMGSGMTAKSFSSSIRPMRTEPTMPRQPIKPTRFMTNYSPPRAATTASPISDVLTRRMPADRMSAVRNP